MRTRRASIRSISRRSKSVSHILAAYFTIGLVTMTVAVHAPEPRKHEQSEGTRRFFAQIVFLNPRTFAPSRFRRLARGGVQHSQTERVE